MKNYIYLAFLFVFASCSKDSDAVYEPTNHSYYYLSNETNIKANQIIGGNGTLEANAITIANNKLYICNGDVLEIFDATTLAYLSSIKNFTKGTTTIPFTKLSSISIDNNRIYLGSIDSRIFVLDEKTLSGINTIGNGQWWQTFVHVFGLKAKDGYLFVKEKNNSIKVFPTAQITETSNWNLAPIAKLNTLKGGTEIYSMDVSNGNLIVAGQSANGFLHYNIKDIEKNATSSLTVPILPNTKTLTDNLPLSVAFSDEWAITTEKIKGTNYIRLYPKNIFLDQNYTPTINNSDIMGENAFNSITNCALLKDRLFVADNTNQVIRVLKLNKVTIAEQK
ncbi:hypothetical protein [Flavobacterium sp. TSSA_36]|uniref:hypothetical protein n=1 Tax=Flavobacterium sp. TSSA_36 TaxID=3447669 RepID=UPI003F313E18